MPAQAFEYPTHIARAEAAITEGSKLIPRARSGYPLLAASLLKEARASTVVSVNGMTVQMNL